MQQPSPADEYATVEELSDAVGRLTYEENLRLAKKARILIWGTEYFDPMELLSEAVKRALIAATGDRREKERGRPWPKNRVELPAFLSESMKSIADSSRESIHQTQTVELEAIAGDMGDMDSALNDRGYSQPDIVAQAIEVEEDESRKAQAMADVAKIEKHFENDQDVLAVLEGEKEEMSVAEVLAMFSMDQKTYDSARRRLRRQVDNLMPGRRLK